MRRRFIEAQDGNGVPHLRKIGGEVGTDARGGRIGLDQVGEPRLQDPETVEKPVVIGVAAGRPREHVILVLVTA